MCHPTIRDKENAYPMCVNSCVSLNECKVQLGPSSSHEYVAIVLACSTWVQILAYLEYCQNVFIHVAHIWDYCGSNTCLLYTMTYNTSPIPNSKRTIMPNKT